MSVTAPRGFRAGAASAGLKAGGRPDVALVVNDGPADTAAAVFTRNRCRAHPVVWSAQVVADGRARAVVLNSGGANCYTGPDGFLVTHRTAERVGDRLGVGGADVVVCSTGLIGEALPLDRLLAGVDAAAAALAADGGDDAAAAIMTTDTRPKTVCVERDGWTVGGMAKGAGMLAPGLATMLVVLTTDAVTDPPALDGALRAATRTTFDRLDSDGCMSTNDSVLAMSSGAGRRSVDPGALQAALQEACHRLAMQLLSDAEGSQHDIAVRVVGSRDEVDAVEVGRAVARSTLFKCAVFGRDPNWGRVLAAVGTTSAAFEPAGVDVSINGVRVCVGGAPGQPRDLVDLAPRWVDVLVDLHAGGAAATVWTNDLTHAYVHENSAYST